MKHNVVWVNQNQESSLNHYYGGNKRYDLVVYDEEYKLENFKQTVLTLKHLFDSAIKNNQKLYFVVELNDYDGYMSTMYLKSKLKDLMVIVGYTKKRGELVFVDPLFQDLLKQQKIICLDTEIRNQINITNHWTTQKHHTLSLLYAPNAFKYKNPISTYGMLHLIFNERIDPKIAFYTDSLYYVQQSYKYNWKLWEKEYPLIKQLGNEFETLEKVPNQIIDDCLKKPLFEYNDKYMIDNYIKLWIKWYNLHKVDLINYDFRVDVHFLQKLVKSKSSFNKLMKRFEKHLKKLSANYLNHEFNLKNLYDPNISFSKQDQTISFNQNEIPIHIGSVIGTSKLSLYDNSKVLDYLNLKPLQIPTKVMIQDKNDKLNIKFDTMMQDLVFKHSIGDEDFAIITSIQREPDTYITFKNNMLYRIIEDLSFYLHLETGKYYERSFEKDKIVHKYLSHDDYIIYSDYDDDNLKFLRLKNIYEDSLKNKTKKMS